MEPPSADQWQAALGFADDLVGRSLWKRAVRAGSRGFAASNKPADKSHPLGSVRDDLIALVRPWIVRVRVGHGSMTVTQPTIEQPTFQPYPDSLRLQLVRAQSPLPMHQLRGPRDEALIIDPSVAE